MAKDVKWIDERWEKLRQTVEQYEKRQHNLQNFTDTNLRDLLEECRKNLTEAKDIWKEHYRHFPSSVWFWSSIFSGFGGVLLLEPTIFAISVTAFGAAGAAKSIYDRSAHLLKEQKYLRLYWRVDGHIRAIEAELARRGIF